MASPELAIAERQITIGANSVVEQLDMARTIHRFESVVAVFGLSCETYCPDTYPSGRNVPKEICLRAEEP